jgi:cytochrome b involved in lipid metabolism
MSELAQHRTSADGWIAVRGNVYDVTKFIRRHPGGAEVLSPYLGRDGTAGFNDNHSYISPERKLGKFLVGPLQN